MKSFIALFITFWSFYSMCSTDPVSAFYAKSNCKTKLVIISINLADCNNCIAPLGRVVKRFKMANPEIPVYLVMSDSLPKEGEMVYSERNEIRPGDLKFVYDKDLNAHLLSKTKGIPNVTLISEERKVLSIRNLKTESQEKIVELISPDFKVFLSQKTSIQNKYAPVGKVYNAALFYDKTFYVFSESMGLIAQYSKNGNSLRDFFIDSLRLDYSQLAKELFSPAEYTSSMKYYETEKPRKSELIVPQTIFKIGEGLLGIGFVIESVKDTVYKKQSGNLMRHYPFLVVVDTAFRSITRLKITGGTAQGIIFQSQGVFKDSLFYFMTYDRDSMLLQISEFKQEGAALKFVRKYPEPFDPGNKYYLQMISNAGANPDAFYVNYSKLNNKQSRIYKRNTGANGYEPEITVNNVSVIGTGFYETKKGNYLFMTSKKGNLACKGYDKNKQGLVECSEIPENMQHGTAETAFFLFDGFLYELTYKE